MPIESSDVCRHGKRKPFQLLSEIFGRKPRRERDNHTENETPIITRVDEGLGSHDKLTWLDRNDDDDPEEGEFLLIPEPREALHSPYHARTIDQDMEHLRLSRQDNPYLQVLASRESLHDGSNESIVEDKHLVSKENISRSTTEHPLPEVHARLVRSPPPVMWTRSRNSEPSFLHLVQDNGKDDTLFRFPPSNLHAATSPTQSHTQSDKVKFLIHSPGRCYAETQYSHSGSGKHVRAVEALSGRFNLSPQPRRRPKGHILASFLS